MFLLIFAHSRLAKLNASLYVSQGTSSYYVVDGDVVSPLSSGDVVSSVAVSVSVEGVVVDDESTLSSLTILLTASVSFGFSPNLLINALSDNTMSSDYWLHPE